MNRHLTTERPDGSDGNSVGSTVDDCKHEQQTHVAVEHQQPQTTGQLSSCDSGSQDSGITQSSVLSQLHSLTCTVASMTQKLTSLEALASSVSALRRANQETRRELGSLSNSVSQMAQDQRQVSTQLQNLRDDLDTNTSAVNDLQVMHICTYLR